MHSTTATLERPAPPSTLSSRVVIRQRPDGLGFRLDSGWVVRIAETPRGQQIVNYFVPGDWVAHGPHDLRTMTPCGVSLLTAHETRRAAHREAAVLAERVVSLGRRDSTERLAHTLCEMQARLAAEVDMKGKRVLLETPFRQEHFADLLGISIIHINRCFRRLRLGEFVEYGEGRIEVVNLPALQRLSGFHPGYLAGGA